MATVLITGANRGIGKALALTYLAAGAEVIATARREETLADLPEGARALSLDVTDGGSIKALAAALGSQPLDILINNAGVFGPRGVRVGTIDHAQWTPVFAANVFAPARVSEALLPHLRRRQTRKIATISSRMGSIGNNQSGGEMIYRSSKAAVNAVMRCFACELRDERFTVINLHPGWVRTDMGGASADISVEESAKGLKSVIDQAGLDQSGLFFNYDGGDLPW